MKRNSNLARRLYSRKWIRNFWFGVILILLFTIVWVQPIKAQEASFYVAPSEGSYKVGETFSLNVLINTQGAAINSAQATIYFPPDILRVTNISKGNSIFTLWTQEPVYSNSEGRVSFGGGLPSPGFQGSAGKVITISFQSKSSGKAKVSFGGEAILANDPWGTNLFASSYGGTYFVAVSEILPPEILPPEILPPEISPPEVQIDTQPPYPFEITVDNEGDPTNPSPLLYFEAKDDLSGISHYEIKIGEGDIFTLVEVQTNPFRLPHQSPGTHKVEIKAVDKAGNKTLATADVKIESIQVPEITVCPDVFVSGEEVLYIEGTALPDVKAIVFLEREEKLIKKWEVFSDEKGNWSLREEGLFKSGIHKVSARAQDSRGAISDSSKEFVLKIILKGIAIGNWIIGYETITFLVILLFLIGLIVLFYLLRKAHRARKLREREIKDLKKKFYKEYHELRKDIERMIKTFKEVKGYRPLSLLEKERERKLLRNLADVERVLREELKDIEKIK